MPTYQYWRVFLKGGRKAHLTPIVSGEGCGIVALCGADLPEDKRKGAATTVVIPKGDECQECRRIAGFYTRPKLTPEQRSQINEFKALSAPAKTIAGWTNITDNEKKAAMLAILEERKKNYQFNHIANECRS
jgi:hypothetical protein